MAKFTLDKYLELLFDMDSSGEFILADDEYIRLFIRDSGNGKNIYVRTVKALKTVIRKYHDNYNIYVGLATTKGENGTAEYMKSRKVLMLDFDKKDYPELKNVQDFRELVRKRLRQLYIHAIVDTGNGYHFYIAINKLTNVKRIADANRALAEIVGADIKATLTTQIARIPTSLNVKDIDNKKSVNIVNNDLESRAATFKPYHLQKIEGMIEQASQNVENIKAFQEKFKLEPSENKECPKSCSYYCAECMLAKGCKQGERNFSLGRITKYLQRIKGYTKTNALKTVLDWNRRCQPPKSQSDIERDFNNYWEKDYKLLACNVPDKTDQAILDRYCDKNKCVTIWEEKQESDIETEQMYFDNNILKNKVLRDLTGYHLVILSVLDFVDKALNIPKLTEYLTGRKAKKCCMCYRTLRDKLDDLVKKKYVIYDSFSNTYSINRKSYKPTYTMYSYAATVQFINGIINQSEYMVYLCLTRNLQQNLKVTYDEIADNLGKQSSDIGDYIKGLHKAGLINVNQSYNERGVLYNTYKLFC